MGVRAWAGTPIWLDGHVLGTFAQSYRTLHRQTQEQLDELRSTLLSPTLPEVPGTDVAARHRAALDGLLGDEVNQS